MSSEPPPLGAILAVDVDYRDGFAVAAGVEVPSWQSQRATYEWTCRIDSIAPYVPGSFFERELPCLLALLSDYGAADRGAPGCVIVDGYAWLGPERPGLGARLYESLGEDVPVIGVAKTAFQGATTAIEVYRGQSSTPLFVNAAGMADAEAARHIESMSGSHRAPTVLKHVDRLARDTPDWCLRRRRAL